MKRLVLLVAVALALVACSTDDDAALTVNGEEVLTVGEFEVQLDEARDYEDFLTSQDLRGAGDQTFRAGAVAALLSNQVLSALLDEHLAAEGIEVTDEDVEAGTELLTQSLGAAGDDPAASPLALDDVPPAYRAVLIDLFSNFTALTRSLDGDDTAAQEQLTELLAGADVDVVERYGHWDADQTQVVPPDGPLAPTTTLPLAPTG